MTKTSWLLAIAMLAACDVPVTTSATAHESPPFDTGAPPPMLAFSSYVGGSGDDRVLDVTASGGAMPHVFAVGVTTSPDFPTSDGTSVDTTPAAGCAACPSDAFVMRLDGPGQIAWSTVIGGPGFEQATSVSVAADGDLYVGGSAASLPATTGAADDTFAGGASAERGAEDGFVCRLDSATGAIRWCTFVGGSGTGGVTDVAGDSTGVVAALTTSAAEALSSDASYSAAFAGRLRATPQGSDAAVVRITGDGHTFSWATFVGGSGDESGPVAVAADGNGVHVLTTTASTDAPVPNGFLTTAGAGTNVYYALLVGDGASVRYGTYLGGNGDDWVSGHSLVAEGAVAVGINTRSTDLGATAGAVQPAFGGFGSTGCGPTLGDGWIAELAVASSGPGSLTATTYVGGSRGDSLDGLARDSADDSLVAVGETFSSDFPTSGTAPPLVAFPSGSPCTVNDGNADGSITVLPRSFALTQRRFGSYLGGGAEDHLNAVERGGNAIVIYAGDTRSINWPEINPVSAVLRGPRDGVIAVLGAWGGPVTPGSDGGVNNGDGGLGLRDDVFENDAGFGEGDDSGCCNSAPMSGPRGVSLALLVLVTAARLRRRRELRVTDPRR